MPSLLSHVDGVVLQGPVTKAASRERSLSGANFRVQADRGLSAVINFCDALSKVMSS
jgi:hypothetical protein